MQSVVTPGGHTVIIADVASVTFAEAHDMVGLEQRLAVHRALLVDRC